MEQQQYDAIIIGAGPAGYVCAIRCAQLGAKVAVVEKSGLGGTCLHKGCIPTKTLLHSAHCYREFQASAELGIEFDASSLSFNQEKAYARKDKIVDIQAQGIAYLFKSYGVDLYCNRAEICDNHTVALYDLETNQLKDHIITDKAIIIATGSQVLIPPIPGIELAITSDDILQGSALNISKLAIIGGGVISVELADYYAALGVKISIFEALDRLIPRMDQDLSSTLLSIYKRRKIKLELSAKVESLAQTPEGIKLSYTNKQGALKEESFDAVLCAVGRKSYHDKLFAEGCATPELQAGALRINESYETSVSGIYAVGDVVFGSIQLAHAASSQAENLAELLFGTAQEGRRHLISMDYVPACIYCSPELASVGSTEQELQERGVDYSVGMYPMNSNARSMIAGTPRPFTKVLIENETKKVLGVHLCAERASDMISELGFAMLSGATVEELLTYMQPHPSFSEGVQEALLAVEQRAIHLPPQA